MPPKKRKIEEDTPSPSEAADVEVKTERLSQEEAKNTPEKVEGKPEGAARNLRPRKSTCYVEKDSPDINFEEKQKKIPRRKRRPTSNEDGSEEKESKIKRADKDNDGTVGETSAEQTTSSEAEKLDPVVLPTLISCSELNLESTIRAKVQIENNDRTIPAPAANEEQEQPKKSLEKKRPRKKPKPKATQGEVLPLDPNVIPKTEPVSPSAVIPGSATKILEGTRESKPVDPAAVKPKPKKRIRNKKPATIPASTNEDGTPLEQTVIKQEKEDAEAGTGAENRDDESNEPAAEGEKQGDDITSKPVAAKKKATKKKAKPQVNKDLLESGAEQSEGGAKTSSTINNENDGLDNGEKEIKIEAETEDSKTDTGGTEKATTAVKKRVKSRPKKPVVSAKAPGDGESKPEENAKSEGAKEGEGEKSVGTEGLGNEQPVAKAPVSRKPFFRGRRSKSISARSGRKEIIHKNEEIDPEDIRGFEHVEKYVTPPGVRLPKFWDSEDEMSEDENNDNFRRIMCGFGTNCRLHEVIRPASEIVRRLKELQNTFGASKSLPLFQKDVMDCKEDPLISASAEPFFRNDRDRVITWHTDPSFFKYANNYPSKCK